MKGLISQTLDWISHPDFSEATPGVWAAGLLMVLVAAFLWSTVVKQIREV